MESQQDLIDLASRICQYEQEGHHLSGGWYDFEQANSRDVERLRHCSDESLQLLHTLSEQLDQQLQAHGEPPSSLQHAYNIVQELISSRTASQEMLENILEQNAGYQEYFRALSLKEKAAVDQANQLQEILSTPQT